jgi:hypothetical protein
MVLTVTSDLSRARHRPGLHRAQAAIAPGADLPSRSGPGGTRQVQCRWGKAPSSAPRQISRGGVGGFAKFVSSSLLLSLGQLPKRAGGCPVCRFTDRNIGSPIATSVHRSQHGVANLHGRSVHRKQPQITESNKGRHTRQLQAGVEVAFKQGTSQ